MPEQTSDHELLAGLPLYNQIGAALGEPGTVLPRGRVYGRGGGPETVAAWRFRAVIKVLTDHGVDPHTVFAEAPVEVFDQAAAEYLVWSHDAGTWWGPNGGRYTGDISQAGRYTLADAQRCAGLRSWSSSTRPPEVVVAAPSPALLASLTLPSVMQARIRRATVDAVAARRAAVNARREEVSVDA